jgi:regulator of protease activity HflC (stomatin/prohibitin superfamily)
MDQSQIDSYLQYRYLEALNEGFVSGNKVIILLPQPTGENIILQLPKIDDDTK